MKVEVKQGLEQLNPSNLCTDLEKKIDKIEGTKNPDGTINTPNPYFLPPASVDPPLGDIKSAIKVVRDAQKAAHGDPEQTKDVLKAVDELIRLGNQLGRFVENVANKKTVLDIDRETIVISAGMEIKKKTKRGKQIMAVSQDDMPSGSAYITGTAEKGATHEWGYCQEPVNQNSKWNDIDSAAPKKANITISGFTYGISYTLRHRTVGKTMGKWEYITNFKPI